MDRRLQIEEPLEPFNLDRMPKKSCGVNEPLGSFIITTYICILGSPWVLWPLWPWGAKQPAWATVFRPASGSCDELDEQREGREGRESFSRFAGTWRHPHRVSLVGIGSLGIPGIIDRVRAINGRFSSWPGSVSSVFCSRRRIAERGRTHLGDIY